MPQILPVHNQSMTIINSLKVQCKCGNNQCSVITKQIKLLLDIVGKIHGKENKIIVVNEIFKILEEHLWFIDLHDKFKETVKSKLLELKKDWSGADKYYDKFFV